MRNSAENRLFLTVSDSFRRFLVFWMFTLCDAKATEPEEGTQTLQGSLLISFPQASPVVP